MLSEIRPIRPVLRSGPFHDPNWIFEIKHDGFRGLAYIEQGRCRLVSRKGHVYTRFERLRRWLASNLRVESAIVDGEICCVDETGRTQFYDLMFRRGQPYFYAFDLLWLNGEDLRQQPLVERKARLKELKPAPPSFLLYVDHLPERGTDLFEAVCAVDGEGIVAKRREGRYSVVERWWKIKNPAYTQAQGRGELFDAMREKPRYSPK